ncbi:unnamed protein product [Prunus armeniaca]
MKKCELSKRVPHGKLMHLPHGNKTAGYRWIYTVKLKVDGFVERYKARLVAKEYTQRYEIDYEETFVPVAKINTIIVILSLAANFNWPLHQFDVKNAFLHGNLEEKEFKMKDWGDLNYFLGIVVARSKTGIFLSQRKYVMDLLTETEMLGCKPADTPIEMNHKLCEDMDQEPTNKEQYQRLVGRNAVDRILRYLKLAPGKGLMFSKNGDLEVVGYTDADWAGSIIDRRSTSSYFTFMKGNLVTWWSKKQNVVSWSSAEA